MSAANFQGNASAKASHTEPSGKAVSESPVVSQPGPKTEMALTAPAVAAASRTGGGDINGSLSHGYATSIRPHESMSGPYPQSALGGYGSLSLAPQRRKRTDGGTTMTLFVRGVDSVVSEGNTVDVSTVSKDNKVGANGKVSGAGGGGKRTEDSDKDEPENQALVLVENAVSTLTTSLEKVGGGLPSLAAALTKPVVSAAAIFLFFLIVDLYTLMQARRSVQQILDSTTAINDQMVSLTAHLAEQHARQQEYVEALAEPYRRSSPADVERARETLRGLAKTKNHSIFALHRHLGYPGHPADIQFLIEQHVNYELRMQKLVESELEWMRVAQNSVVARSQALRVTRVVIGDNADDDVDSFAEVVRRHVEHITYPLRAEMQEPRSLQDLFRGINDLDDEETSESSGGLPRSPGLSNKEANGYGGSGERDDDDRSTTRRKASTRCRKNCGGRSKRKEATRESGSSGASRSAPSRRKNSKAGKVFDAFVEVKRSNDIAGSPLGSRVKLEEISVSERSEDDTGELRTGSPVVEILLSSRLFVFFALCVLMYLFSHVN